MSWKKNSLSPYRLVSSEIELLLHGCLEGAAAKLQKGSRVIVFFRADDIGVPGEGFAKLIDLFRRKEVPLTLSVVPAWLSRPRWQRLQDLCGADRRLWCWTQHGWRHVNHEPQGKKLEFGPGRTASERTSGWVFSGCASLWVEYSFRLLLPPGTAATRKPSPLYRG